MNTQAVEQLASGLHRDDVDFERKYAEVLNQLNELLDHRALKSELVTYAVAQGKDFGVLDWPSNLVGLEGKICFCLNRGAVLHDRSRARVHQLLERIQRSAETSAPVWEPLPTSAKGRQAQQYVNSYSQLDNLKTRVLRGALPIRQLALETRASVTRCSNGNSVVQRQLLEHYRELLLDAQRDPTIQSWIQPISVMVETLHLMVNNKAAVKGGARAARARKMSSTVQTRDRKGEQAATKVKIKAQDTDSGITSVDPTNVVGATSAVFYNTKTRHVEVYHSLDGQVLSIQGARVTNFDPARSRGKILRKPESWLPRWTGATTTRRLDVLMADLKGKDWELSGKINSNHLILKVL